MTKVVLSIFIGATLSIPEDSFPVEGDIFLYLIPERYVKYV